MTITQKSSSSKALLNSVSAYLPADRASIVEDALNYASNAHQGQLRESGEPFIEHPIATALRLADMRLDTTTIQAALLHDVMEDCGISFQQLESDFGNDVAKLVDGVTKLKRLDMISENSAMLKQIAKPEATRAASLRKMLVAMADDVRVVLIKLSDRLHNMQTLQYLPIPKQQRISRETLDIYSPLAHRLGMSDIKWQLEDQAFRYLMPRQYKSISRLVWPPVPVTASAGIGERPRLVCTTTPVPLITGCSRESARSSRRWRILAVISSASGMTLALRRDFSSSRIIATTSGRGRGQSFTFSSSVSTPGMARSLFFSLAISSR
mgnify:CR=1 FL=1